MVKKKVKKKAKLTIRENKKILKASEKRKLGEKKLNKNNCCWFWNFNFWLRFIVIFILISVLVYVTVLAMSGLKKYKYIGEETGHQETITIEGVGEVYAKPDVAVVVFSVRNEAKTVAGAMQENSGKMNEIIYSIKAEGVDEKDLKTISFNLYPRYEYIEDEEDISQINGNRVLVGYEIIQSLQIKIKDMGNIGSIIQQATNAGASQVGSLSFTIDDEDKYKEEARRLAIEEAKNKAEQLAFQLGIKLLGIKSFSENINGISLGAHRASSDMFEIASPNIEVGQNKIEARISIVYKIKD